MYNDDPMTKIVIQNQLLMVKHKMKLQRKLGSHKVLGRISKTFVPRTYCSNQSTIIHEARIFGKRVNSGIYTCSCVILLK